MLEHLHNFIRERDLGLKKCLSKKNKSRNNILCDSFCKSFSIKTRCCLCGVAERGLTCSLETICIGVYLVSNTELLGIKILLVIREGAMIVSLNDKVTKLQKT